MESASKSYDVIVIGAGQAGLAVGYFLAQRGMNFVILDGQERVGDSWRKRWDSLRLFSAARFDGLPGMTFPAHPDHFPSKDEMADYLAAYAERFSLPVQGSTRVERVRKHNDEYVVTTNHGVLYASQVVVAMGSYQRPYVPALAQSLRPEIVQIHSSDYRSSSQLVAGPVLVVGAGNSGAEIAKELAQAGHLVWLAGRDVSAVPFRSDGFWARLILCRLLFRVVFHRILTIATPIGRAARPKLMVEPTPLIRTKRGDLSALAVQFLPKVTEERDGLPSLEDGRRLEVSNIVWCTGFNHGLDFIDLPVFDRDGEPMQESGVVSSSPGFYFVGLHFMYAMSSGMIHGVGRDAERIAGHVSVRASARRHREPIGSTQARSA